ncbi:MAG: hypothetical protein GY934_09875 [Gammaproteobacteria bacterium]|nr:hypothetical protein [Gammaproteobacteria bacterium]
MSSEQRALEIIKTLAENIQAANAEGVQVRFYGDDDETTLEQAILSCAGIEHGPALDHAETINVLLNWLHENRGHNGTVTFSVTVGKKLTKIIRKYAATESVYAFVALHGFTNKLLGQVKAGQIFKPASWAVPARHPRGDLYNQDTWAECFGDFSVRYMN